MANSPDSGLLGRSEAQSQAGLSSYSENDGSERTPQHVCADPKLTWLVPVVVLSPVEAAPLRSVAPAVPVRRKPGRPKKRKRGRPKIYITARGKERRETQLRYRERRKRMREAEARKKAEALWLSSGLYLQEKQVQQECLMWNSARPGEDTQASAGLSEWQPESHCGISSGHGAVAAAYCHTLQHGKGVRTDDPAQRPKQAGESSEAFVHNMAPVGTAPLRSAAPAAPVRRKPGRPKKHDQDRREVLDTTQAQKHREAQRRYRERRKRMKAALREAETISGPGAVAAAYCHTLQHGKGVRTDDPAQCPKQAGESSEAFVHNMSPVGTAPLRSAAPAAPVRRKPGRPKKHDQDRREVLNTTQAQKHREAQRRYAERRKFMKAALREAETMKNAEATRLSSELLMQETPQVKQECLMWNWARPGEDTQAGAGLSEWQPESHCGISWRDGATAPAYCHTLLHVKEERTEDPGEYREQAGGSCEAFVDMSAVNIKSEEVELLSVVKEELLIPGVS